MRSVKQILGRVAEVAAFVACLPIAATLIVYGLLDNASRSAANKLR